MKVAQALDDRVVTVVSSAENRGHVILMIFADLGAKEPQDILEFTPQEARDLRIAIQNASALRQS